MSFDQRAAGPSPADRAPTARGPPRPRPRPVTRTRKLARRVRRTSPLVRLPPLHGRRVQRLRRVLCLAGLRPVSFKLAPGPPTRRPPAGGSPALRAGRWQLGRSAALRCAAFLAGLRPVSCPISPPRAPAPPAGGGFSRGRPAAGPGAPPRPRGVAPVLRALRARPQRLRRLRGCGTAARCGGRRRPSAAAGCGTSTAARCGSGACLDGAGVLLGSGAAVARVGSAAACRRWRACCWPSAGAGGPPAGSAVATGRYWAPGPSPRPPAGRPRLRCLRLTPARPSAPAVAAGTRAPCLRLARPRAWRLAVAG